MKPKSIGSLIVFSVHLISLAGPGLAQTQADLSVEIHPKPSPSAVVRVLPKPGYSAKSEVHHATGGQVRLSPTREGHEGEGEINYQVNAGKDGTRVHWNSRTHETSKGAPAMPIFPPPPPSFVPPIPPGFPQPSPIHFPVPPAFGQPPVGFPAPPPPFFPSFGGGAVPPVFPAAARTVTSSTGDGDVEYYQRDNGSGMSWSSRSSSTFQSTWPPEEPPTAPQHQPREKAE